MAKRKNLEFIALEYSRFVFGTIYLLFPRNDDPLKLFDDMPLSPKNSLLPGWKLATHLARMFDIFIGSAYIFVTVCCFELR